jgi:hypothetical protein
MSDSDSDEESLVKYGTPLDPIEEGNYINNQ